MVKNWIEPEKYFAQLPRKRCASGMVILNKKGELLLVKASYKKEWSLAGGMVNKKESPLEAVKREVREEVGLVIENPVFLGVKYVMNSSYRGESLQFFFGIRELPEELIKKIKIDEDEVIDFGFFDLDKNSLKMEEKKLQDLRKLKEALVSKKSLYWEGGLAWEEEDNK